MLYLAFVSSIFRKSSLEELRKIMKFKIVGEFNNFLVIDSRSKNAHVKTAGLALVYFVLPLYVNGSVSKDAYRESILRLLCDAAVDKGGNMKLECINLNSKTVYSAKDLEVWEGRRLEKLGYAIDMEKEPVTLVYFALLDMKCYVGHMKVADMPRPFVNPFRHYHTQRLVSRSELKIEQAFDEFAIDGVSGVAIDLGAAPGGWSCYLARRGYDVIAVDNGKLDAKAIRECGVKIKTAKGGRIGTGDLVRGILHVKERSAQAAGRLKVRGVSLLADDMNIDCSSTYKALSRYSQFLDSGGLAIVTIKCITKYLPGHARKARKLFSAGFRIRRMRVLPANRQEFTLFIEKK